MIVPAAPFWDSALTAAALSLQRGVAVVMIVDPPPWPVDVEEEADVFPVGTGPASLGPLSHPARNAAKTMTKASALVMFAILRAARNPPRPRR